MGSLKYLDARNGFRDVTFGTPLSQYPDMELAEDSHGIQTYKRPHENLQIGTIAVQQIGYSFYKNQLYAVIVIVKGSLNSSALLETLTHAYGAGTQPNPYMKHYFWAGQIVYGSYTENSIAQDGQFVVWNKALQHQKETDEAKQATRAAAGL
jgi:hypothetical protein